MGAGKSAAARAAARVLGADYVDTDHLIADEIPGGSIAGFFREQGEARFRELEERVVLEALERPDAVVALGGGAIESEPVRAALADHVTAWCRVDEEVAWDRCAGTDRPLARDRDGFRRRYARPAAPLRGMRAGRSADRRRAHRRRRGAVARPAPRRPRRSHVLGADHRPATIPSLIGPGAAAPLRPGRTRRSGPARASSDSPIATPTRRPAS